MKQFIVTFNQNRMRCKKLYETNSVEEALGEFVKEVITKDEDFIWYLYEFTIDGFSGRFMDIVPGGKHHGIDKINKLKGSINEYFENKHQFAEIFFAFFMKWYPVESEDRSKKGKELLNSIIAEMKTFRFPEEMEQFIAIKECHDWCDVKVTLQEKAAVLSIQKDTD